MYTKKRSEFGRQPLFSDVSPQLHVDIEPDDSFKDDFIEKNPVDMAIQYASEMSEHEVYQDFFDCIKCYLFSLSLSFR